MKRIGRYMTNYFKVLFLFVLSGCAVNKMHPNEQFLSIASNKNKIYVISIIPSVEDSSGVYLSTFLMSSRSDNNYQVTAFVNSYDSKSRLRGSNLFFVDSIRNYNPETFPILFENSKIDSSLNSFSFTMSRNSLTLKAEDFRGANSMDYVLGYAKQIDFETRLIGSEFNISEIMPIESILKKWNRVAIEQKSILNLHVIKNGDLLFSNPEKKNYYWLDFVEKDQNAYTVFFEADKDGHTELVFSTHPDIDMKSTLNLVNSNKENSQKLIEINSSKGEMLMSVQCPLKEKTQINEPTKYSANPVKIIKENNTTNGIGILYEL